MNLTQILNSLDAAQLTRSQKSIVTNVIQDMLSDLEEEIKISMVADDLFDAEFSVEKMLQAQRKNVEIWSVT